jgi:hypothetical protein
MEITRNMTKIPIRKLPKKELPKPLLVLPKGSLGGSFKSLKAFSVTREIISPEKPAV